jgi:hypothetical protein
MKKTRSKKSRDIVPLKGLGHQVHISFKSYQIKSVLYGHAPLGLNF